MLAGLVARSSSSLLSRTAWRPDGAAPPRPPARLGPDARRVRRGCTSRDWPLFVGLGVLFVPIALLITLLQALLLHATSVLGVESGARQQRAVAFVALALGTTLTLLGLGLVQAATARRARRDRRRTATSGRFAAYRLSLERRAGRSSGRCSIAVAVVSLLASSLYLLPIAVWLAVRWALVAPVVELEDLGALAALRRSRRLVRGRG